MVSNLNRHLSKKKLTTLQKYLSISQKPKHKAEIAQDASTRKARYSLRRQDQGGGLSLRPALGGHPHLVGGAFQRLLVQEAGSQPGVVLQLWRKTQHGQENEVW